MGSNAKGILGMGCYGIGSYAKFVLQMGCNFAGSNGNGLLRVTPTLCTLSHTVSGRQHRRFFALYFERVRRASKCIAEVSAPNEYFPLP